MKKTLGSDFVKMSNSTKKIFIANFTEEKNETPIKSQKNMTMNVSRISTFSIIDIKMLRKQRIPPQRLHIGRRRLIGSL
jgi:hypothetical protein